MVSMEIYSHKSEFLADSTVELNADIGPKVFENSCGTKILDRMRSAENIRNFSPAILFSIFMGLI